MDGLIVSAEENVDDVLRLLELEWGADHRFITRAAFTTDRLLYDDEQPDVTSHFNEVFGLDQVQRAISDLAPAIADAKRAANTAQTEVAATQDSLSQAEARRRRASREREQAVAKERAAREEAVEAQQLVKLASRARDAASAMEAWREARARIAKSAEPIVGPTNPDDDLRNVIAAAEGVIRAEAESVRERHAVLQSRIHSIEAELARLQNAEGDCPVCRRPLDSSSRSAAEAKHAADRRTAETEFDALDLKGLDGRATKLRDLLRRADELGDSPFPEPPPAGDLELLMTGASTATETHETAVADVREAEIREADATRECDEIQDALSHRGTVERLFRRQAMLETASAALNATTREVVQSELGPIIEEVNRRWDALFADRPGLRVTSDGAISRPLETQDLSLSAFSSGEKMAAILLVRLAILVKTTRVPFLWIDEPLEHLDPDARRFVATTLAHLSEDEALAQIVVTTYEEPLANMLAGQADAGVYLRYLSSAPSS